MAHPENFPSGIKALAAYAHGKGLKLGLYTVRISPPYLLCSAG